MSEQQKKHKENLPPSGGGFGFTDGQENTVNVGCGPYNENLPVAGMSIEKIRKRFKGRLEIDDKAVAVVDGNDVDNDYVVNLGQKLQFIHKSGEKGGIETVPTFNVVLTEKEITFLYFALGAGLATAGLTQKNMTTVDNILTALKQATEEKE